MTNWPKPLSNIRIPLAAWLNRFLAAARERTPIEIEGYNIEAGSDGFRARKKFQAVGTSTTKSDAEISVFVIAKLLGGDYFIANKLFNFSVQNGTDFVLAQKDPTPVLIAKPVPARMLKLAEVIDGVKITYRLPPGSSPLIGFADNNRIANDGVSDEVQCLYPRYVQIDDPTAALIPGSGQINTAGADASAGLIWTGGQSVVYAQHISGGTGVHQPVADANSAAVEWLEVQSSRVWAKRYVVSA